MCVSLIVGAGSVVAEGHRSEFAEAVMLVKQKEYSSAYSYLISWRRTMTTMRNSMLQLC